MKFSDTELNLTISALDRYIPRESTTSRVLFAAPRGPYGRAVLPDPQKGMYPNFIKDAAKKIWDELLDTYAEPIEAARAKYHEQGMWAVAIIVLRRMCYKQGIGEPFDSGEMRSKTSLPYRKAAGALYMQYKAGMSFMESLRKALAGAELIADKALAEYGPSYGYVTVKEGANKNNEYHLTLYFEFDSPEDAGRGRVSETDLDGDAVGELLVKKFSFKKLGHGVYLKGSPNFMRQGPGKGGDVGKGRVVAGAGIIKNTSGKVYIHF